MTNRELLYILTIAEYGNFSMAAEKLNVTQSAMSQAIRKVEGELGFKLFFRGGVKTRLTTFGQQVVHDGKPVMDRWNNFEDKLRNYTAMNEKQLTIYAPPLFYKSFLPSVIREFSHKHPEVTINAVESVSSTEAEVQAETEKANLALVWEPVAVNSLARIPVFKTELLLAVPASHPFCMEHPFKGFSEISSITPEEFSAGFRDFPMALPNYRRTQTIIEGFVDSLGFQPDVRETSTVWSYLMDYVRAGNRVALIDELECTSTPDSDRRVAFYRISPANLRHSVVACFCPGKTLSKPEHWFIDALEQYRSIASI
ncbi:MAG: LysR family transcriptional regulator [Spirochaetales bacterium]|nr:LysR family transcriptional regulator [Spirochaetales bacterium]